MKPNLRGPRPADEAAWRAAPVIAARFPQADAFALELEFRDPAGQVQPSGFRRVFTPSMQAYFRVGCVLRDCLDGGFDLNAPLHAMLGNSRLPQAGKAICRGHHARKGTDCGLELQYRMVPLTLEDSCPDPTTVSTSASASWPGKRGGNRSA